MSASAECLETSRMRLVMIVISIPHDFLRGPHTWWDITSRARDDAECTMSRTRLWVEHFAYLYWMRRQDISMHPKLSWWSHLLLWGSGQSGQTLGGRQGSHSPAEELRSMVYWLPLGDLRWRHGIEVVMNPETSSKGQHYSFKGWSNKLRCVQFVWQTELSEDWTCAGQSRST